MPEIGRVSTSVECQRTFRKSRSASLSLPSLLHPDPITLSNDPFDLMTCLPSISSLSDNESEDSAQEVESELRMAREAPTPLAARFRNLGRQSPEPAGLVAPPSPPGVDELPSSLRFDSVAPSRSSKPRPGRVPRVRQSQVRSCDQCRTSKQKVTTSLSLFRPNTCPAA